MNQLVEQYLEIRKYLTDHIANSADVYFSNIWDPYMKFIIIKETNELLERLMKFEFPDFPAKYFPKVKFRIFEDEHHIEAGVQTYLNKQTDLIFLGTNELGGSEFDFYIGKSLDPNTEYMFFAKYGHACECQYSGAKVAAAEYFQGAMTPLSVAFGMAVEDGFIT